MKLFRLLLVLLFALLLVPSTPSYADTAAGKPVIFRETGHTLAYSFRHFYDRQGGLSIFGYPITEVYLESGRPVQYFERARLEWHANLGITQATHLGRWAAQGREAEAPFQPIASAPAGATFYPETRHSLGGIFRSFWNANGGLPTFGYPISEPFEEVNPQDGRVYMVQYFERTRFEYHPNERPGYQVLLGHLGRQHLAANPAPEWALQPVSDVNQAWNGVRPTRITLPRIGVDTTIVEAGFTLNEWDVPRYTAAHYWPIGAYPNTAGNIIIAGHVGYRDIIFNKLPNVQNGDELFLTVNGQNRRYVVQEVLTLLPSETWVMNPTNTETVTLITCVPIGVYSHRLIVRATPG